MLVNLLLTTISSLFSSVFEEYLVKTSAHVWSEGQLGDFHIITFGSEINGPQNAFTSPSLSISCSSSRNPFDSNETQSILRDYYKVKQNRLMWTVKHPNMSCVIFDLQRKLLWLIGDHAGATPLWFAFQSSSLSVDRQEMIITTDLLAGVVLNYSDLTAVGAGLTLAFDINTFEILSMNHWSQHHTNDFSNEPSLSQSFSWSVSLLNSSQEILSPYFPLPKVLTELDLLDASSILLDCAISTHPKMKDQFRVRYNTAPLVTDVESDPEIIDPYIYCKCFSLYRILSFFFLLLLN